MTGALIVAAAVVFLRLGDVPEVVIYADGADVGNVEEFMREAACPAILHEGVSLPIPYRIQWLKQDDPGERREVPDQKRKMEGLLARCPERLRSSESRK